MAAAETGVFGNRLARDFDRLIKAVEGLDDEAVNWKPPAPGANSLLVIVTHAVASAEDHVVHRAALKPVTRSRDAEFAARGSASHLAKRAEEVKRRIDDALAGLDPAGLGEERPEQFPNWPGRWTVRDTLVHAVAHTAEHAGQAELTRDLWRGRTG
ncbi:MAG TPA: DinB family protein [Candidatus Limnocylindria bacterium]|jgi:uncharacterized damage-inducible protein DinB|nr:DinB family protein [Candidatus Limnocylindria bacterium]